MTDQAFTQTMQAHRERIQRIDTELDRLIGEAKEITQQLQRLQADRLNTQRKETVQP